MNCVHYAGHFQPASFVPVTASALWYPCTQMHHLEQFPPLTIARAQGAYLYTTEGTPILDAISSWWVNLHGHCHPFINQAVMDQLGRCEQVMLAGLTHEPIEQLAERLVALTPAALTKAFFADSGSAAVEVALKMSLQYWQQCGETQRKTFISLENGYHGETLGSLSVTDIPLFSAQYAPLLIQHLRAPSPALQTKPELLSESEFIQQQLNALEHLMQTHDGEICALILEPLVQGAAGMHMYPASYLKAAHELCDRYRIHLILDEIAVGFGRTGTLFAHEQAGICPDFLCLSKGLTAGYLPMSCVLTTDDVYAAFYHPSVQRGFLHSHSFTGNPLAARAALASLDWFEQQQVLTANQPLIHHLSHGLDELCQHPHIRQVRQTGMIGAFTLVNEHGIAYPAEEGRGRLLARKATELGVLLRPIGNQVYLMPPYCVTPEEIQRILQTAVTALEWAISEPPLNQSAGALA